ncbi:MAG: ATP-binding protein [Actinomycetota bacterium]|nr:ATP-binding protein [Actinomycetota bacterium]
MKVEAIPVRELVEECLRVKGSLAERSGISLEASIEDPRAFLHGDRRLLMTAVNNLIDNAMRNNRSGGKISIAYRHDGTRESIMVSDTGKGIPYDELRSIKDMFCWSGKRSIDELESVEDELIGLSIVRDVADLHGGRVGVRSLEGEGSTFSFHLPRRG